MGFNHIRNVLCKTGFQKTEKMKTVSDTPRIAIVGGGAAGFFAAIAAKKTCPKAHVTIIEKNQSVLRKVAISGGGRCNLTNTFESVSDLKQVYPRGHRLMKRLFREFSHTDAMRWFEAHGVPLVVQPDQCVFPRSQDAQSVVRALTETARRLQAECITGHAVRQIEMSADGAFRLLFEHRPERLFDRVIITTGGSPLLRHYGWLSELGHHISVPIPSLFTFDIADKQLRALMGTVIEKVSVSIPSTHMRAEGEILITHWGVSGPAVLRLSSYAAPMIHERHFCFPISVNWIYETNRAAIEQRIAETVVLHGRKQLSTVNPYELPSRLWSYLLRKLDIDEQKKWGELGRKNTLRLMEILTNDCYKVGKKGTFRDEFVTCGGVDLADIHARTLESKLLPGLYFAGEVADVDAVTGGFNLQAAWTMGYVAGRSAADGCQP